MSSSNNSDISLLYVGQPRSALKEFSALLNIDGAIFDTSSIGKSIERTADESFIDFPPCDLALVLINAQEGVSQQLAQWWSAAREKQIPRLIVVTDIDNGEIDFDDIVLIANRILDPVLTPYLVLHGENGEPTGIISLETLETTDYSTTPPTRSPAENDLVELVNDFRTEFFAHRDEFGEAGFADGLLFPAIPYISKFGIGRAEITSYLNSITPTL